MKKIILCLVIIILIIGCSMKTEKQVEESKKEKAKIANPASVYCEEQGGKLDIRDNEAGQYGVCIFPDGSECEEWKFYRGECEK